MQIAIEQGYVAVYPFLHAVGGSPQEIRDWQEGKIELEFDPHWHVWGCRPTMGVGMKGYTEKTGVVFVVFYESKRRYRNAYKTLMYELGHAVIPVNMKTGHHGQITSPAGLFHPYYLNGKRVITRQELLCRYCGGNILNEEGRPTMKTIHDIKWRINTVNRRGERDIDVIAGIEARFGLIQDTTALRHEKITEFCPA